MSFMSFSNLNFGDVKHVIDPCCRPICSGGKNSIVNRKLVLGSRVHKQAKTCTSSGNLQVTNKSAQTHGKKQREGRRNNTHHHRKQTKASAIARAHVHARTHTHARIHAHTRAKAPQGQTQNAPSHGRKAVRTHQRA